MLYRLATEVGATKIALGHHLDDFIETLLLNLFFAGALKAMPARLVSDNGEHVVIRPLVGVTESEARNYAKERSLPIIGCCCPACGDLSLQRQRIKRLIAELEVEHPEVKSSMIKALANVAPPPSARPAAESAAGAARSAAGPPRQRKRRTPPCRTRSCGGEMRAVVQRVKRAKVVIDGTLTGGDRRRPAGSSASPTSDGPADVEYIVNKTRDLRIFPDDHGRMNRSVVEVGGGARGLAVHAARRLPQGPPPVVRRRGAGPLARALYEDVVGRAAGRRPDRQHRRRSRRTWTSSSSTTAP